MEVNVVGKFISKLCEVVWDWIKQLNWGTVPDWVAALGTILAVFVAIYIPYRSTKSKGTIGLEFVYYPIDNGTIGKIGLTTSIFNTGLTAINVRELSIGIVGNTNRIVLSTDFKGGIIQPGEGYTSGVSSLELFETLTKVFGRNKTLKIYAQATDSVGTIFKGKKVKIDLRYFREDMEYQRELYLENPLLQEQENLYILNTKKI